jgi:hypothetical protein
MVTVSGPDGDGSKPTRSGQELDPLRSLRSWLVDEDELRGRVRLVVPAPGPGELGALAEALQVLLAPGGAAATLAAAIVSWARRQRTDLRVTLRGGDRPLAEVEAKRLRGLDAANLPATIDALRRCLDVFTPPVDAAPAAGAMAGGDDAAAHGR